MHGTWACALFVILTRVWRETLPPPNQPTNTPLYNVPQMLSFTVADMRPDTGSKHTMIVSNEIVYEFAHGVSVCVFVRVCEEVCIR